MKTLRMVFYGMLIILLVVSIAAADVPQRINYQGKLTDGDGNPVTDNTYFLKFKIYGSASGDDSLWYTGFQPVLVTGGLFSYQLGSVVPIPDDLFAGSTERYLGITVGGDPELDPRTKIVSVAYAYHALRADSAQHAALATSVPPGSIGATEVSPIEVQLRVASTCPPGYYMSEINEDGTVVCVEDQAGSGNWSVTDSVLYTNNFWGIARGGAENAVLGTQGHTVVNLGVACTTGVAGFVTIGGGYLNTADGDRSTIGGGSLNVAGGYSATIAGGVNNTTTASQATIGGGKDNVASGNTATIGGGTRDTASGVYSTVSGGEGNHASGGKSAIGGGSKNQAMEPWSTVAGGRENIADGNYCTVGGGRDNTATSLGSSLFWYSTVSGGRNNTASGQYSTIAGGSNNSATGECAIVTGGCGSKALGDYSLAAGSGAIAKHDGAFVWADASGVDLESTEPNQFLVRATGGTKIYSNIDLTAGVTMHSGASAWAINSDRNLKDRFTPVDTRELLDKIASLPITTWNYKSQDESIRHIGPMAQDFSAAFGVGEDDTHISTVDADGVALAAIQALLEKIELLEQRIGELEAQNR